MAINGASNFCVSNRKTNIFIIANNISPINDRDLIIANNTANIYNVGDKIFRLNNYKKSKYRNILIDEPHIIIYRAGSLDVDFLKVVNPNENSVGICGYNLLAWSTKIGIDIDNFYPKMEIDYSQATNIGFHTKPKTNTDKSFVMSQGIMVAFWCQNFITKYQCFLEKDYHIYLVGFSFEGWEGHDWEFEKKWYKSQRNISLIC